MLEGLLRMPKRLDNAAALLRTSTKYVGYAADDKALGKRNTKKYVIKLT